LCWAACWWLAAIWHEEQLHHVCACESGKEGSSGGIIQLPSTMSLKLRASGAEDNRSK
jgi:hypothetical protein